MSVRNKEVVPGLRAPVLDHALLSRIHELNRDYVDLLIAQRCQPPAGSLETLSARTLDALERLTPAARDALAQCPYTLFSAGFENPRFWRAALDDVPSLDWSVEDRYGALSVAPMQTAFCEAVLFLALHAAHSQPLASRFLFGMPDTVANLLLRAPLWRLRRVAMDYPALLAPRWPRNPAFWPDLIRFSADGDARLEAAHLLGTQLMAASLEGALPQRLRQRSALRHGRG